MYRAKVRLSVWKYGPHLIWAAPADEDWTWWLGPDRKPKLVATVEDWGVLNVRIRGGATVILLRELNWAEVPIHPRWIADDEAPVREVLVLEGEGTD